jgi:hypothetical protein
VGDADEVLDEVAVEGGFVRRVEREATSPGAIGTGRKPRLSAQMTRPIPTAVSNSVSGTNVAASVDQRVPGARRRTR